MRRRGRSEGKLRRVACRRVKPCTSTGFVSALIRHRRQPRAAPSCNSSWSRSRWLRSERGPNFSRCILAITIGVLDQRLRARELGARLDQRRLQRIGVVGKVMISPVHGCDISTIEPISAINSRTLS